MALKFELNTGPVESSAAEFDSLSGQVSTLSSTVSGYDSSHISYSCRFGSAPWNAEIDGAKGIISQNMATVSKRITNISKAVTAVVDNHSRLQAKMQFTDLEARDRVDDGKDDDGHNQNQNNYGSNGVNGATTPGGGTSGSNSGSGTNTNNGNKKDKIGPVETELTDVGYVYPDQENLTEESKAIFNDPNFKYDEDGFARIGDRYVVACDYSIGNIGDVLRFTQTTGEVIECVIGVNTFSEKYKHTLNFIVDEKSIPIVPTKETESIIEKNRSVDNIGPLAQAGTYVRKNRDGVIPADVQEGEWV